MKNDALPFLVVALLLAGYVPASAELDGFRLDPNVAPTFQQIELHLDATETDYSGSVRIDISVAEKTNEFAFTAEEMNLDRVFMRGADGEVSLALDRTGGNKTHAADLLELSPRALRYKIQEYGLG